MITTYSISTRKIALLPLVRFEARLIAFSVILTLTGGEVAVATIYLSSIMLRKGSMTARTSKETPLVNYRLQKKTVSHSKTIQRR